MRLFSKPPQQHVSPPVGFAGSFIGRDFLRMVVAAIAVGLLFSAGAATVALLLAGATNAAVGPVIATPVQSPPTHKRIPARHDDTQIKPAARSTVIDAGDIPDLFAASILPAPGNLFIPDGCGGNLIFAIERDIQITIDRNIADIRVMQTFMVEPNDANTPQRALFQAGLPDGADLRSLHVQTDRTVLLGQFSSGATGINNTDDAAGDAADARRLKSQGLVRYFQSPQPAAEQLITTDLLTGLEGGESLVVIYRYQIPVVSTAGNAAISLPLLETPDADHIADGIGQSQPPANTATSVWVIWADAPKRVLRPPAGLTIEHSADGTGRIEAASWHSTPRLTDRKFQLAWIQ